EICAVIPGWRVSARPGIWRFRVRCFASPRNDREFGATKTTRTTSHAASARQLLCAGKHRADRRLARQGEDSRPPAVDAAQERLSGPDLSDQSELRRYRRAEVLQDHR